MAKFTELEKEKIREELLKVAYRFFIDKGFKSTSLEDITSSVGIAKSSFYIFFESKEMLYMELLAHEGEQIQKQIWPKVIATENIRLAIKMYLNMMALELESKILTQRLVYDIEEYKLVSRKLNPEYVGSEHLRSIASLMEFIKSRQDSKEIIDEDPGVIAGVLRSALLIGSQKRDLQQYNYERIRELLFEAVANQIARP
ncbi:MULTISPECIES: TetR/AcrR family transcriptional regulator [Clostridium]|jgi:AcrR family transcriptional regulator|uniref:TetR/AcrR family transcriptional regulator n=1 Tax=Candidatus Clostridium helianthi TaxID=3381660 RepID=A0ABW8S2S1_9CLOT|nr:TetR/AcrR family transcriptional regulator [Clostridium beijerinckii]MZK52592.1 TetR family transcriptional regulator [Clostridium beijerinckii]MZK60630.1 TetR family transcriptional regulator [Clostridium beijerinckii]MZK70905.1 TetR family transcriptional regulator [Clostridium beijerinckii]MZK76260.1 TetR family transcriptional regulator [Clostridium beijerinckii]MZK85925.1 TetR family transcriptional regulator [Clostridium beijerinckii]